MKHAEVVIERILFLDATPNMTELMHLNIGAERQGAARERPQARDRAPSRCTTSRSKIAREEGDNSSRELFEKLLKDEEEHVDWLEAQVHQIKEMGYERYLSQQIREEK